MGHYLCRDLSPWPSTSTDGRPLEIHTIHIFKTKTVITGLKTLAKVLSSKIKINFSVKMYVFEQLV